MYLRPSTSQQYYAEFAAQNNFDASTHGREERIQTDFPETALTTSGDEANDDREDGGAIPAARLA